MRRQPVARSFRRQPVQEARFSRTARPQTLPPPVGGWNARDALQSMKADEAVRLVNWFPKQSNCVIRPGYAEHCDTALAGKTTRVLIPFEYGTTAKMIAAVDGSIIECSTQTPSTLASGLGNDYWVHETWGGKLFLCNGVDTMKTYDGTTVSNATFTGPTLADLNFVEEYKSRLFFVKKNSQVMYYGGVGAVTGALTAFDFSTIASVRGNLMLLTHLKGDGGDGGTDDVFLAIFQFGDVIAYTGSNPGDANNWALLGKYRIGRPLSRFGIYNGDDDVYIVTSRGYEKLTEIVKFGASAPERLVMSGKIQSQVTEDIQSIGASDDWSIHLWPAGQMLIVNVPKTGSARNHHVRNINTGAWCQFSGFSAFGWCMFQSNCYFGSDDGKIYKFSFSYTSDAGSAIVADGQQAWNSLGYPGYVKTVELVRASIQAGFKPPTMISIGTDFKDPGLAEYDSGDSGTFYYWDSCYWDESYFFGKNTTYQQWVSRNASGHFLSMRVRVSVSSTQVKWNGSTILYSLGGPT